MDAPDAYHGNLYCLDDFPEPARSQHRGIFLAASGIEGPYAQVVRPLGLGFQRLFQIVGRNADDGLLSQYRPGFLDGFILLAQMDPICSQDLGRFHIVVH